MALEVAINELRNTVDEAKAYYCDEEADKLATVYRSYAQDIVEDIHLLEKHRAAYKEKEQEVAELMAEARRQKRELERAAFVLEAEAKKAAQTAQAAQVVAAQPSRSFSTIKLPRIKLPVFDGERSEDYRGFIDAFLDAVDSEPDLGEVKKWLLLKAQLAGKALNLVRELPTAPETYKVAKQILEDAYGSQKRAILKLYQRLHQLPVAVLTTESLRATHAQLEGILLSLGGLGVALDQDDFLRAVVMGKYPGELAHTLRVSDDMPLQVFRREVNDYIKLRDCTLQPTTVKMEPDGNGPKGGADGSQRKQPRHLKNANQSNGGGQNGSAPPDKVTDSKSNIKSKKFDRVRCCVFCSGTHWSDECEIHRTLSERSKLATDRCQRCLKPKHADGACGSKRVCYYCKDAEHNSALCPKQFDKVLLAGVATASNQPSRFVTAMLPVSSALRARRREARALFDTAGGRSLITADLAAELELEPAGGEQLRFVGVNNTPLSGQPSSSRKLWLFPSSGRPIEICVFVVPRIVDEVVATDVAEVRRMYARAAALDMPSEGNGLPVRLLLGYRSLASVVTLHRSIELDTELQLMSTRFGWVPFGGLPSESGRLESAVVGLLKEDPVRLMSDLELVGLGEILETAGDEELAVLDKFNASIKRVEGRYEVEWPYRYAEPELEDNFGLAYGRLVSLYRQLVKNPATLRLYDQQIRDQLESGVVEVVNASGDSKDRLIHYLPHRAVIRVGKSTPLRVVFDAAARTRSTSRSLNDVILKGGNWVTAIPAVLIRFRRYGVAVTCDIEKAFHQIAIAPRDRDVVRFLWLRDAGSPPSRNNLCIYRFRRMAFGVVAGPFLLTATIRHHLRSFPNEHAERIEEDLYADNLITSLPRDVDGESFYQIVKECFASMSMNIAQWATDDPALRRRFKKTDAVDSNSQTVLGIEWNLDTGEIGIRCPRLSPNTSAPLTKRIVLRELASVYDPLGWAAPVVLMGKMFLRRVWRMAYAWDAALAEELVEEWRNLRVEIGRVGEVRFARPYGFGGLEAAEEVQLHTFCDASIEAYGVVVYLCVREGSWSWSGLVAARTRLAPNAKLSVPRLELLAAVMAARYTAFVERSLKVNKSITKYLWGDSRCVIAWYSSNKVLPAFVNKAVKEIRAAEFVGFNYVPSEANPADVASRGATLETLRGQSWWRGPEWLVNSARWPLQRDGCSPETTIHYENLSREMAAEQERVLLFGATLSVKRDVNLLSWDGSPFGIDPSDCQTFGLLLRRTAYCRRAAGRFLRGRGTVPRYEPLAYEWARRAWLRWDQERMYESANTNKSNVSYLKNLRVFTDAEGLMRCHTRLANARVARDEREPILLVKRSVLTRLIVISFHRNNCHAGTAHTLAALRRRYWLPHGRREVYHVLKAHCHTCRRQEARPFRAPNIAPLPAFRINRTETPFTNVGVDVFGPFAVYAGAGGSVPKQKRWGVLFTCLVVRAVHIEMLRDMTPEEFLNSLRRFVGRRGAPRLLVCDNAPAYYVIEGHFKDLWRCFSEADRSEKYFAQHEIKWHFITPEAPWMGGAYERLIREIKVALSKVYGERTFKENQLELAFIEIEGILNTRPITYVDRDTETELLSPSDFLGMRYPALPMDFAKPLAPSQLTLAWKAGEEYLEQFWRIWAESYLRDLRERRDSMGVSETGEPEAPKQGELVLMIDPTMKRSAWRMAVIERLITSQDGKIRSAQVRMGNRARLIRAVSKLAPLRLLMNLPADAGELTADRRGIVVSSVEGEIVE